jgi:FkbM family methyltransferase
VEFRFLWRAWKARLRDERAEIHALCSSIRDGETAVDVGANKGSYLYWLSRSVGSGTVVAFEPQPELANYLRTHCAPAGLANVTVEAAGVSDRQGELMLHVPGDTTSPGASLEDAVLKSERCRSYTVPVLRLDDYFRNRKRRIAAMKIDVEGHELAVLRGAQEILDTDGPCLVVECERRHLATGSVEEVMQHVIALGYDCHFVDQGRLRPIAAFDPDVHQENTGDRFFAARGYCNNFVLRKIGGSAAR